MRSADQVCVGGLDRWRLLRCHCQRSGQLYFSNLNKKNGKGEEEEGGGMRRRKSRPDETSGGRPAPLCPAVGGASPFLDLLSFLFLSFKYLWKTKRPQPAAADVQTEI